VGGAFGMKGRAVIDRLRTELGLPLPGPAAHSRALPPGYRREQPSPGTPITGAAVLLALHHDATTERFSFPLIRRPDSMERHAGQIALPGGVIDAGESPASCALREAEEEIGLDPDRVEILGQLTSFIIPVSGYRVTPFIGSVVQAAAYRAQEAEVMRILIADPDRLADEGPRLTLPHERDGVVHAFPAYDVDGERVWGATALILAEFLEIWRRVRRVSL
jgi:8-oxo-dGTP pyrophosphatase MutT (NUDIX family)